MIGLWGYFILLVCCGTHLPPVKVLDDGQVQELLPLPLALHGVVEEFAQRPIRPLQQLVVQQQGVGGLCGEHREGGGE